MSKENAKTVENFVTAPAASLVSLSSEDLISMQNVENCIKMISFFTLAKDEHVQEDIIFLDQHFKECLESDLMDEKDQRIAMLNIIRQYEVLRTLTQELDQQKVVDALQFLSTIKKVVIANNPKLESND